MAVGEVVEEPTVQQTGAKRPWSLTQRGFQGLLDWLDEDADSAGQRYMEMRHRMVLYFDRKNCISPDELADETLNRVARRLEEEGAITSDAPAQYCYIVARFVLLESLRNQQRHEPLNEGLWLHSTTGVVGMSEASEEQQEKESRLSCLEKCIGILEAGDRELIVGYYHGEQRAKINNRKAMAATLGISINALSIRACRIRDKLEACARKCLSADERF
jgi:DNA-directed RNA polymerase specialized sigma24 family protein